MYESKKCPGSTDSSISDYATGFKTISVGAFSTKSSVELITGETIELGFNNGEIASFSGYGPDMNGIMRPDIVAPGNIVVSSGNSYNLEASIGYKDYIVDNVIVDGKSNYYLYMSGTSMATPAVSGIIALCL